MDGALADRDRALALCAAADRLASAALWTVAHMSYATRVDLSGADLAADAFKTAPEGHMGGSLNAAIAFVGFHLANALTGQTRAWVLGQGHCVAAIEAVNALLEDLSPAQQGRYGRSEVPEEEEARLAWLYETWAVMDDWIDARIQVRSTEDSLPT